MVAKKCIRNDPKQLTHGVKNIEIQERCSCAGRGRQLQPNNTWSDQFDVVFSFAFGMWYRTTLISEAFKLILRVIP